jgi:hypothetical protein
LWASLVRSDFLIFLNNFLRSVPRETVACDGRNPHFGLHVPTGSPYVTDMDISRIRLYVFFVMANREF